MKDIFRHICYLSKHCGGGLVWKRYRKRYYKPSTKRVTNEQVDNDARIVSGVSKFGFLHRTVVSRPENTSNAGDVSYRVGEYFQPSPETSRNRNVNRWQGEYSVLSVDGDVQVGRDCHTPSTRPIPGPVQNKRHALSPNRSANATRKQMSLFIVRNQ